MSDFQEPNTEQEDPATLPPDSELPPYRQPDAMAKKPVSK